MNNTSILVILEPKITSSTGLIVCERSVDAFFGSVVVVRRIQFLRMAQRVMADYEKVK